MSDIRQQREVEVSQYCDTSDVDYDIHTRYTCAKTGKVLGTHSGSSGIAMRAWLCRNNCVISRKKNGE